MGSWGFSPLACRLYGGCSSRRRDSAPVGAVRFRARKRPVPMIYFCCEKFAQRPGRSTRRCGWRTLRRNGRRSCVGFAWLPMRLFTHAHTQSLAPSRRTAVDPCLCRMWRRRLGTLATTVHGSARVLPDEPVRRCRLLLRPNPKANFKLGNHRRDRTDCDLQGAGAWRILAFESLRAFGV